MIKRLKNIIKKKQQSLKKKYYTLRELLINSWCYFIYYHIKLDENLVFVESRDGKDFTGNMFRMVEELSKPEYRNYKIVVYAKKNIHEKIVELCKNYNLKKLKLIDKEYRAVAVMERAKYILSDSGVPWKYVKREGQVVLNTWHGTPLKLMGRHIKTEEHIIGTPQHFFFSSDYLLYPSAYMKEVMLRDYMVENVISGKALMGGYPRNSVFFDAERREYIRTLFGYTGKRIYAYLPTHRGNFGKSKNSEQLDDVIDFLSELDTYMCEDQMLLVKLHVYNQSKIDFVQFKHIFPFPSGYETYDILNAVDCLITDYSSVMFDFANSKRKIILFTYDMEDYFQDRGTYFPLSSLPFPNVKDVVSLYTEMGTNKCYDDINFLNKFCTYDSINATQKLCKHIFTNEKILQESIIGNGKDNVLLFGGSLAKNGITTSLINLLSNIDTHKRNYYVSFRRWELNSNPERVGCIPSGIDFLPLMCDQQYTLRERICYEKFSKQTNSSTPYPPLLKRLFQREIDRYYWGAKFSHVIQFDGYGKNITLLFLEFSCTKTVFVHSDMIQEIKNRRFQHFPTLKVAYQSYDKVAVVSPALFESTSSISGRKDNIVQVNNIHDYIDIRQRAELPIEFQKDTELISWNPGGIEAILNGGGYKFITVGRYSKEKGHLRLIDAFDKFCESYPDSQLIIIGGHGNLYTSTIRSVKEKTHWKNITLIKSLKNPMPIVKNCDLFILPSLYEGFGLVLLEADCLGVPTFSTDIAGPKAFLEQHNGYVVSSSTEGILQGMYDFVDGKVHTFNISYEEYNTNARLEFENLLTFGERYERLD